MAVVTMPQMGESVVEGTLERWLVREGEHVEKDQNLCEITTDKVDTELPAPEAGVVTQLLVAEGETVQVGAKLAVISASPEAAESNDAEAGTGRGEARAERAREPERTEEAPAPAAHAEREGTRSTPLARRVADERGLDLDGVRGSGTGGRVTKADVLSRERAKETDAADAAVAARAAEAAKVPPVTAPQRGPRRPAPATPTEAGTLAAFLGGMKIPQHAAEEGDTVVPFTSIRRRIAEHMVVSKIVSPHVGTVAEVDMHALVSLRDRAKAEFRRAQGFNLTYLPFVVHAAVRALKEVPRMNASVVDESIVEHRGIHIGVAVETERGLLVPVVRDADRLSLTGLACAVEDLASRARERNIGVDELRGGTFTITNPGREGNLYGFAVINQPQVGILRMGEIRKRPVVIERDGEDALAIHPMMYLALSYDHRIIDGVTGNGFLYRVAKVLEAAEFEL